jgi:hypothetical protein
MVGESGFQPENYVQLQLPITHFPDYYAEMHTECHFF